MATQQSFLAKLGMRMTALGSAASVAIAFPSANGDETMAAHTAANRTGFYAAMSAGAEQIGLVVGGVNGAKFIRSGSIVNLRMGPAATPADFGSMIEAVYDTPAKNNGINTTVYSDSFNANFGGRRARGTAAAPSAVQSGDVLSSYGAVGYGATGFPTSGRAKIQLTASENWTDTAQGTFINFFTTVSGTTTTQECMRLTNAGMLRVGLPSTLTGSIVFAHAGGAPTVTLQADTTSASYTLKWPAAQGAAATVLTNDGLGQMSWAAIPAPTLTATYVGFGSAGNVLTGSNKLTWTDSTGKLVIAQGTLSNIAYPIEANATWNMGTNVGGGLFINVTDTASYFQSTFISIQRNGQLLFKLYKFGLHLAGKVIDSQSAATIPLVYLQGGAHTNLNASSELVDVNIALNRTVQWATGAKTTQRAVVITPPTYAFVGASVITTAASLAISGAPAAGANATITNSYALWVQAGASRFDQGTIVANTPALAVTSTWNNGAVQFTGLKMTLTDTSYAAGSSLISLETVSGGTVFSVTADGRTSITQSALSGITAGPTLSVVTGAHTALTAGVELNDVYLNCATNKQFATGAIATLRTVRIRNATYSFAGASTITNAATLAIADAPAAGTNATITNSYALWVQSGAVRFDQGTITAAASALSVTGAWNNAAVQFKGAVVNMTDTASTTNSRALSVQISNFALLEVTKAGILLASPALAAALPSNIAIIKATPGAYTNMSAGSELNDVNLALARTVEWAAGAITTQRAVLITAPTYAFVGASTITNAATFAIGGAPAAGTNATITNSYALWVQAGASRFDQGTITAAAAALAVTSTWNNAGVNFTGLDVNITDNAAGATSYLARFRNENSDIVAIPYKGGIYISQETTSATAPKNLIYAEAQAHNNMTAGTEYQSIYFKLSRTFQFATGAVTTQRAFYVDAPTYAFVGASTITTAATFAIANAPVAGTNATITNSLALWVQDGATSLASLGANYATANVSTVLDKTTFYFTFTGSTAAQTITLPAANLYGSGRTQILCIRNKSTVSVTIARAGADTIDGGTSITLPAGAGIFVMSDGTSAWDSN